jgi:hypothetical protein
LGADFSERADDVVRVIVDPILAERSGDALLCAEANVQSFAQAISSATDGVSQSLSVRLTEWQQVGNEDQRRRLGDLAHKLGVETRETPPPPHTEATPDP